MSALNHQFTLDPTLAHRQGSTRLTITGPDGAPLARTEVEVAQRRHEVEFACISPGFVGSVESTATELPGQASNQTVGARAFGAAPDPDLAAKWLGLFDTATLPFYLGAFEPEEGKPKTAELRAMAQWCHDNGVRTKGHPPVSQAMEQAQPVADAVETAAAEQEAEVTTEVAQAEVAEHPGTSAPQQQEAPQEEPAAKPDSDEQAPRN